MKYFGACVALTLNNCFPFGQKPLTWPSRSFAVIYSV